MHCLSDLKRKVEARDFPLAWPGQWCDGAWLPVRKGGTAKFSANPNTGEKLLEVTVDKESVATVVEASAQAKARIAATSFADRVELLDRFRRTLVDFQASAVDIMRLEAGKPLWEAQGDFTSAVRYFEWVIASAERIFHDLLAPARLLPSEGSYALMPMGITAAYLPFSTPITSFAVNFSASVLSGSPLIVSASSHALLMSAYLALLAREADLPPSLLNIVFGNFNSFKQLLGDKRVTGVIYTGSREHCDTIRLESKAHLGRQIVLQSGGKNAVIVHSSADLDHATRCVVYGALKSAGQRCTSTSRVFTHASVGAEFRERLVAAFGNVKIGRTDVDHALGDEEPFMGPLYSEKAVEKFLRFQTMANRESEKTLLWGRAHERESKGNFVTPSVHDLARFDNSSAYQGNVLFSPDVAIYDYEVLDTAIEQINTTDAAFAVSFIGDPDILTSRRHMFLAPNLLINKPTVEMETTLPLAGRLQSGHHRFHGPGIALYLCYPQVLDHGGSDEGLIRSWPWPKF